jgi:8-oxo-dGTP pyrophosphatase MutT (NUDIX family)
MPLQTEVTVAALAERDGRFLVVEESIDGKLVLNQPAGHLEPGETLLQAVARETREETAWRFVPQAFLGVYLWQPAQSTTSFLRFAFAGTVSNHDAAQTLDAGIVCTHWLTRAELAAREAQLRTPLVLRCVDDYLSGRRLPLDAIAHVDGSSAVQSGPWNASLHRR